jgi:RAB protein geranylgeranyltransferase component A
MATDIYIAMVSSAHNVCPKGYYVAIVSTIAETSANHHLELEPGFERLGEIEEKFMGPPIPLYAPIDDGKKDNIFISKSYDPTSHFETTTGKMTLNLLFVTEYTLLIRCQQMMFVTSTDVPRATSWLSKDSGRGKRLLARSKVRTHK